MFARNTGGARSSEMAVNCKADLVNQKVRLENRHKKTNLWLPKGRGKQGGQIRD